jgi:hypothetical protein
MEFNSGLKWLKDERRSLRILPCSRVTDSFLKMQKYPSYKITIAVHCC